MSKWLSVIVICCALLLNPGLVWAEPNIVGTAGILIDAKTGQILYAKNIDKQMYPASTTKVLTGLVALEQGNLNDKVVIDKEVTLAEGSSIYLTEGETITLEELVYALLLNSANDAAVAIAKHVGGSVPEFAQLMNERARTAGAKNSNFVNPNGLPNEEHVTSAYDLAMITKAAMDNPKFRAIVGAKTHDINRSSADTLTRLINHNKLLWRYEGATGVKTGYTVAAQQCLIGSAKRGDQELIAVVLSSVGTNIWTDVTTLLDYGFDNFKTMSLVHKNTVIETVKLPDGKASVAVVTRGNIHYTVHKDQQQQRPTAEIKLKETITPPIKKGEKLGEVIYYDNDQKVGSTDLLAANSVAAPKPVAPNWWHIGAGAFGVIFIYVLYRGYVFTSRRRRRRLRRNYYSYDRDLL